LISVRSRFQLNEWRVWRAVSNHAAMSGAIYARASCMQARKKSFRPADGSKCPLLFNGISAPIWFASAVRYYHPAFYKYGSFPPESELALNGATHQAFLKPPPLATRQEFGQKTSVVRAGGVKSRISAVKLSLYWDAVRDNLRSGRANRANHEQSPNC